MENYNSKAPRVEGFNRVSFWREDDIGIVAILYPGSLDLETIDELIRVFSTAELDDKIKSLLLMGTNNTFSEGIKTPPRKAYPDFRNYYDHLRNLIYFILSMDKPIITFIGQRIKNNGISLALLSDLIISADNYNAIWDNAEPPLFLSTISFSKNLNFADGKLRINSIIVNGDDALGEAVKIVKTASKTINPAGRKYKFDNYERIILEEQIRFLDFYLWCEGSK